MKTATILAISAALAALRVGGHKGELFQAVAHLWVSGLFCWGLRGLVELGARSQPDRLAVGASVAISLVELACFLASLSS